MSRLGKRVAQLEGDTTEGTDIIAEVPHVWPKERQAAEVEAIALAHGAVKPFRNVILLQNFEETESDHAEIIFLGRFGVDEHLDEPLGSDHKGAGPG